MKHEKADYYVGLLKAAELRGATYQAVMEFQVIASKRLPKIHAGRCLIVFYFRKDIVEGVGGIEPRKTDTGTMRVSSPALTALDLMRYPQASAGIANVVTVLSDLAHKIDGEQLAKLSSTLERPVVQRLGYLLDLLSHQDVAQSMYEALFVQSKPLWVELDRIEAKDPDLVSDPIDRNQRWRVTVRRRPEIDAKHRRVEPARPLGRRTADRTEFDYQQSARRHFFGSIFESRIEVSRQNGAQKLHLPAPLRYSEDIDLPAHIEWRYLTYSGPAACRTGTLAGAGRGWQRHSHSLDWWKSIREKLHPLIPRC